MKSFETRDNWTEARIEQLKALLALGISSQLIGDQMGISRNAIIGKVRRLGLQLTQRPGGKTPHRKKAASKPNVPAIRAARKRYPVPQTRAPAELSDSLRLSLEALKADSCRFPEGDVAPFRFCGHPQETGSSYCPGHRARCVPERAVVVQFEGGRLASPSG